MAKLKNSKILVGFLVLVMVIGMFPFNLTLNASAVEIDSYSVKLTDGSNVLDLDDVAITLTNKADESITATVNTVDGVAVFENFVEEEASYVVSVEEVIGYDAIPDTDIDVAVGNISIDITMTAIDKVTVSGIVTDENGNAYEGATVSVSGYVTVEVTTDAEGKYSYDTYAGKENIINITADEKYNSIPATAVYNTDATDANYQLTVKTFNIKTTAEGNGTITDGESNVLYGENRVIKITADEGFRIKEITVNGEAEPGVKDKEAYEISLNDIDKDYTIKASFYKATYTVSFDVSANGNVEYNTDDVAIGGKVTDVTVEENGTVDFKAIASSEQGYHVEKVVIGDDVKLADGTNDVTEYTGTVEAAEINTTVVVTVVFATNEYNVTVNCGENGSASWGDNGTETTVNHDGSAVLTIVPDENYNVDEIIVNGSPVEISAENDNTYEAVIENITADSIVNVTFVEKEDAKSDSYIINLPENYNTVDGVIYAKGIISFEATGEYKRVKVTYINKNGSEKTKTSDLITTIIRIDLEENVEIISIEASKKVLGDWDKPEELKIKCDSSSPEISYNFNDSDWFKCETEYSFTCNDTESGVKEVKYSETDDINNATVLNKVDDRYSFTVSKEFVGVYYIWVSDYCGNVLSTTVDVKIDTTNPTIGGFEFVSVDSNTEIQIKKFGIFSVNDIQVTVTASDENISSGLKEITLVVDGDDFETAKVEDGKAVFTLSEDDFNKAKKISAYVTDNAGNKSEIKSPETTDVVHISAGDINGNITPHLSGVNKGDMIAYKDNFAFDVIVSDKIVGISSVVVYFNEDEIKNYTTDEIVNKKQIKFNTKDFEKLVLEGVNTIKVVVTNNSGVVEEITKNVFFDSTPASIVKYSFNVVNGGCVAKIINFLTFGIFFNEEIEIVVTTKDVYENSSDVFDGVGVDTVTLTIGDTTYTENVDNNTATFTIAKSEFEDKTFSGLVSAVATDKLGNTTEVPVIPSSENSNIGENVQNFLMLEVVEPTIEFGDITPVANNKGWHNKKDIEIPVNINDADSGLYSIKAELFYNGEVTSSQSSDFNAGLGVENEKVTSKNISLTIGTVDGVVFNYVGDGEYKIIVTVSDNCGNVSSVEKILNVDTTSAVVSDFDFGRVSEGVVEETEYGYYFKEDMTIAVTLDDTVEGINNISDIAEVYYYTVDYSDIDNPVKSDNLIAEYNAEEHKAYITIQSEFKGQIYVWSIDNAGNDSTKAYDGAEIAPVKPDGSIVEDQDKHDEEEHIFFEKEDAPFKTNDAENNELYADDVDVTITVEDTYSGIREIEWFVVAPYGDEQNGSVTVENDKDLVENVNVDFSESGWEILDDEINLVTKMQKTILVNNDSNNIVVNVKMTDRAGNISEESIEFSIDKQAPIVTVKMNDNDDADNSGFFKNDRKYTVTVLERNFLNENVKFDVSAIDDNDKTFYPTVTPDFKLVMEKGEPKVTVIEYDDVAVEYYTYEWVGVLTADGEYTFTVSADDLAANATRDNSVSYVNEAGTDIRAISNRFTIDQTDPEITIVYDNNSAMNGNYYKEDRVATITIKEHNFDESRFDILGSVDNTLNSDTKFPVISEWVHHEDNTHTTTIAFNKDAKYTFDIQFRDEANNSIADFVAEEFTVDTTAPNLTIGGVADKSANKGDVIPVISYSDINFNKDAVSINLSGVNYDNTFDASNFKGSYRNTENGQTYTYEKFEDLKEIDGIYTLTAKLTDMAGNSTEKTITFSVNRHGSVYDITELNKINGKYIKKIENDVVITEINADQLDMDDIKISLSKNKKPRDLILNKEYTVKVSGGDGEWYVYTYTIDKSVFAEDGEYVFKITSNDAAGNKNINNENVEIGFFVDDTNPKVNFVDLNENEHFTSDKLDVKVEVEDAGGLKDVKIYVNGKLLSDNEYTVDKGFYTFTMNADQGENNKQSIKIVAVDEAGNETVVEIEGIVISTNLFIHWYTNKALFIGSIIGVVVLALGITTFIVFGKKKKKKED